jgi:crossover junction endodeoxyribonuclease RuvC
LPPDAPYVAGIDPGMGGGVAFVSKNGGELAVFDMPVMAAMIDVDHLSRLFMDHPSRLAVVERGASMPKQGVASTFKFGMAFGAALAVPSCLKIPVQLVAARTWKKEFKLTKDKEGSRALAIQTWPGCGYFDRKKDHGRAEAALIAWYGWIKFVNERSGSDADIDRTTNPERR